MARFEPVRSPVLDTLLAHRQQPLEVVERPPQPPSSLAWLRLALTGVLALGAALLFRFPPWAVLSLPSAALATQTLHRRRWPFRAACSAALAAYVAQITAYFVTPADWGFRFGAAFALFMVAALFWGLRMDEFA